MVNVTKSNFLRESNRLLNQLPTAAFCAIDLEMTGISLPTSGRYKRDDTPEERYDKIKVVPERYGIIQAGVALFHENPEYRRYICRKFRKNVSNNDSNENQNDQRTVNDDNDGENESVLLRSDQYVHTNDALTNDLSSAGLEMDSNSIQGVGGGGNDNHEERENDNDINPVQDNSINNDESNSDASNHREEDDAHVEGGEGIGENNDNSDDNISDDEGVVDDDDDDDDEMEEEEEDEDEDIEPPEFLVHKYNFYLFPPVSTNNEHTREVTLNPSSISFLNEHNMDYNKWVREGIPYTTLNRSDFMMEKFREKHRKKQMEQDEQKKMQQNQTENVINPEKKLRKIKVEPSRPEDVAFVARTMASLREWIDSATHPPRLQNLENSIAALDEESEGFSHLLPPCNAFLRRCLYETVEYEYPTLILEKAPEPHINRIRVLRLNPDEKKARDERLKREEWNKIHTDHIGFSRVFKAISEACCGKFCAPGDLKTEYLASLKGGSSAVDSENEKDTTKRRNIPLIVHNGLMDLLFMLTHFHSHTLPRSYVQAKDLIRQYFPVLYDTKILSSECSDADTRNNSTALGDLYSRVFLRIGAVEDMDGEQPHDGPRLSIVNDRNDHGIMSSDQLHEAAYDAYMTGAVFHGLCRRVLRKDLHNDWTQEVACTLADDISKKNDGVGSLFFLDERRKCSENGAFFGKNKLYLMQTLYTIDLNEGVVVDPLSRGMSTSTTYRVSGIDSSVCTRDIVRVLMHLTDTEYLQEQNMLRDGGEEQVSQKVGYEIVWVDDFTFMVATRCPEDGITFSCADCTVREKKTSATLTRHGLLIRDALKRRFPSQSIITLEEHLSKSNKLSLMDITSFNTSEQKKGNNSMASSGFTGLLSGILSFVGLRKRQRDTYNENEIADTESSIKRRKIG